MKKKRYEISGKLRKFLLGEGPLDGVWFGEPHPKHPGRFWWRAFLRAETASTPQPRDIGKEIIQGLEELSGRDAASQLSKET